MLALKRLGFTLDEMAELTMADYIALTDIAYGKPAENTERMATQADIDAFLG